MRRILLVEDNDQNRYLISYLLKSAGYEVEIAEDGVSGLEAGLNGDWDAILLDIQLPGLDGFQVLDRLRIEASLDSTPIVAITSHAMAGDRERILAAGCTDYIEKPIVPETFVSQIERHLSLPGE